MKITQRVKKILANYESDNPGTKGNIARILMTGKLAGTGKMVILPVDQGFEHGPARSFAKNPAGYDPHYHYQLAIDAGLNAFAAPLGMLEAGADSYAGAIPTRGDIWDVFSSGAVVYRCSDRQWPARYPTGVSRLARRVHGGVYQWRAVQLDRCCKVCQLGPA